MLPKHSHRRLNRLTGDYVLVSPHRTQRPWQGKVERLPVAALPTYDPQCYLCPGNARVGGHQNPSYPSTFVFDNDFAALSSSQDSQGDAATLGQQGDELLLAEPESGICRVVCFSPRHDLTLPLMSVPEIETVLTTWTEETRTLGQRDDITCVQVFENKGEMMGCSNPHPHSQIWATRHLPNEHVKELANQRTYYQTHGRPLLLDVLAEEQKQQARVLLENDHFVALVPFWALWPFETLVLPKAPVATLLELTPQQRQALAEIIQRLTIRYDNLFEISFPYSMGFHQAPFDGEAHPEWIMHMHFYPPLLRSATVRKFMVGYEMLGMPGRDITPEEAAARLRSMSDIHYLNQ